MCHSVDSDSAFDFFGPAILYLISSKRFSAYKIGVAGKNTTRLAAHKSASWDTILFTHEALGYEVNYVEQFVLSWLREEMGVEEAVSNDVLPEKGGTETWAYGTVTPEMVWEKALEQFEGKKWPMPVAVVQGTAKKKARRACTLVAGNEQCLEPYYSNGYCRKHFSAWKAYGDPLLVKRMYFANTHCEVVEGGEECGKPKDRKGMCKTHYWRDWANGSPTALKRPAPEPRVGICSVEECGIEDYSRGLCKNHYSREYKRKKRGLASLLDR